MKVAIVEAPADANSLTADPLDHLADTLFHEMGSPGVYGRTALYEDVVERIAAVISRNREPDTEVMRFPPVMNRAQLEKSGYLKSFPNLLGCVCGLHGLDSEIDAAVRRFDSGGDWTASLSPADLVLSPAACYPVYPIAASRGPVPPGGWRFDVAADCFRREPSRHLDRLQSFRMREFVCIGSADLVSGFRERWMMRAQKIARDLGLTFRIDHANDPFFGRVGQMMAVSQKQLSLKFELLVPLRSEEQPTACMSFNYHRDHFGMTWGIVDAASAPAHTACVAFGMDRLAVAMFHTHGKDVDLWPIAVRDLLGFPEADRRPISTIEELRCAKEVGS
ncbi:amino acid--[acyl-carrier-protein] ligase [Bradyrhizobium sp. KB893862 SZCCT0404]|uniref:amino acid--[acyl-carrier-protein] ligase n=1 Tax=Bradyrhizobium sp. KB893862 SZCCT0404 TaxID=2807672 RepID=UPI001BAA7D21|nr:amino acid--[acyl-carrier-protein] ligase [Bradyrhizobium sp. KB893862 SZCCT0404]MBR1172817.1 amino acid--[acyl-carrier-protein] ligase [Bradyrhizobium sp. KB893862 SZCCT0404]